MKAFMLEIHKSRRKRLWLIILAAIALQGAWLLWATRRLDEELLHQGYALCLYQMPLLNAIILPIAIAVFVSRLCDMEHLGSALKALFPMQTRSSLFNAKLLYSALWLAAGILLQGAVILAIGHIYGFLEPLPLGHFALFLLTQFITSLFIALLMEVLALHFVNQFIPLAAGLIFGFLGLMSMFFPAAVMRLVPISYYGLLSTVTMSWNQATREVHYHYQPGFPIADCLLLLAATAALYTISRAVFAKQEV